MERRNSWKALQELGLSELENADGSRFLLDHGRLVSSWGVDQPVPLRPVSPPNNETPPEVPPSVETGEEAQLIWAWIESSNPRIIEASGSLSLPSQRVVRLQVGSNR